MAVVHQGVWGQVNQLPKTIEWPLESPQANPQNMSGDFGARRGAEAQRPAAEEFRGFRSCCCGSLPQFLWRGICCYNCVIAAILGLFSQTNGRDRNRISLSPRYPMFATELRGVSSRCRQNLQPLPKHARPQLQIFDQMGQIHYQ